MVTSLKLYLDYPAGTIVQADEVTDVGCGMYPCYYIQKADGVYASTSVVSLITELGSLERNPDFEVQKYITELGDQGDAENRTSFEQLALRLPSSVTDNVPKKFEAILRNTSLFAKAPVNLWYPNWDTIDRRINRLRPFETVTSTDKQYNFKPTRSLDDPAELVEKSVDHITRFVHRMEDKFPEYQHVVLTGGKDSQLISLVPKQTDNWHIFSAEPNYRLVKEFVKVNDLDVKYVFRHDNTNDEAITDLQQKLLCSDLMSDPRHLRWVVRLKKIANKFDGKCLFWSGTEADTIYRYFPSFHESLDYFEGHTERAASWQAIGHQTRTNFTGAANVSPYHSEHIWDDVYQHYDPSMIEKGMDLRTEIGERLHGDSVKWPDRNPGPDPYEYDYDIDALQLYLEGIQEQVDSTKKSVRANV